MTEAAETYLQVLGRSARLGYLRCRCVCGIEKDVRADHIRNGVVKSCGCMRGALGRRRCFVHGQSREKRAEYGVWLGMVNRCSCPTNTAYKQYGANGIRVCARWRGPSGFLNFMADLGPRPSPAHSIDRIDSAGNYEPTNCRWATRSEQTRNRRCTVWLEWRGERHTLTEWAAISGVQYHTLKARVRRGWPVERMLAEVA